MKYKSYISLIKISSVPAIAEMLQNWDITQTDNLLEKLEAEKERRKEMERQKWEAETSKYVLDDLGAFIGLCYANMLLCKRFSG